MTNHIPIAECRTGEWSPDETETLAEMMAEGGNYVTIAAALGRTKWSVRSRWAKLVRSMGDQAR